MVVMRALIHDPAAQHGLRLGDAPDPVPGPGEALVEVAATSLNFGEVAFLGNRYPAGGVPGWEASGVVLAPAGDGSGPPAGARVVTFGWSGGWAERRVVDISELAVLPSSVDHRSAAALPVAGVTALRAVRRLGPVVGRRVLVTGASGGVGRFAVQLAAHAGARVVGSAERGRGLGALGAAEVVVDVADVCEPVSGVIDNVGGALLARCFALLSPGGAALSVGMASLQPTTIDFEQARIHNPDTRVEAFNIGSGVGPDLAYLAGLLAAGELDPQIGWHGSWERVDEAVEALLGGRVRGKAVLEVGRPGGRGAGGLSRRVPRGTRHAVRGTGGRAGGPGDGAGRRAFALRRHTQQGTRGVPGAVAYPYAEQRGRGVSTPGAVAYPYAEQRGRLSPGWPVGRQGSAPGRRRPSCVPGPDRCAWSRTGW
jgi:NADPH:quinone reductase